MKIFISGGSNSVMKKGYTYFLKKYLAQSGLLSNIEIKNISVGTNTSLMSLMRLLQTETIINSGDCIIWEYGVNDINNHIKDREIEYISKILIMIIAFCNKNNLNLIPLIIYPEKHYKNSNCFLIKEYHYIFNSHGISVIDIKNRFRQDFFVDLLPEIDWEVNHHIRGGHLVTSIVGKFIADEIIKIYNSGNCKIIPPFVEPEKTIDIKNIKFINAQQLYNLSSVKTKLEEFSNSLLGTIKYLDTEEMSFILEGTLIGIQTLSTPNSSLFNIKIGDQDFTLPSKHRGTKSKFILAALALEIACMQQLKTETKQIICIEKVDNSQKPSEVFKVPLFDSESNGTELFITGLLISGNIYPADQNL